MKKNSGFRQNISEIRYFCVHIYDMMTSKLKQ